MEETTAVDEENFAEQELLSTPEAVFTALTLGFIVLLTVCGNTMVISAVFTYRRLQSVQNIFLVSLAVADIAVAVLVMPFSIVNYITDKWIFGLIFCKTWLTCDVMCCTASILNLCAIAMDRYWAIHDPINYVHKRTLKRVLVIITFIWIASALVSAPPLMGWNDWPDKFTETTPCQLSEDKGYIMYSSVGAFFIPLVIMMTVYIRIFMVVHRRIRIKVRKASKISNTNQNPGTEGAVGVRDRVQMQSLSTEISSTDAVEDSTSYGSSYANDKSSDQKDVESPVHEIAEEPSGQQEALPSTTVQNAEIPPPEMPRMNSTVRRYVREKQKICLSKERRAAHILGIVIGAFVVCWLPFFIMYIILPFCGDLCPPLSKRLIFFFTWLGYLNSALNPIIYTIFNMDFRRAFGNMLLCRRK